MFLFIKSIGERRGGRFVDQPQHFQPGDAACILRSLTLRIVEVGGHGDDRLRDRAAEKAFRIPLQLPQNKRRNLRRRVALITQLDAQYFAGFEIVGQPKREELQFFLNVLNPAPHQPFDGIDRALRRIDEIFPGCASDDDLIVLAQRHH